MDGNSPDTATLYYDDGTISVSSRMIVVGAPYNQSYNLASIIGIAHGKDESGKSVKVLWIILAVFGVFFGLSDWQNSKFLSTTIIAGSVAILAKMIQGLERSYVELKFGGLNNQMLFMKKMEQAEHLSAAINMAIQDMHTPPEPGQAIQSTPIFPSPVFSRN
jgi:hypothetical protein